ncbi:MAG: hypothetical protein HYZ75_00610 [Elusimicrobia bacterium]|nr:hypothetical protein [Elusimicrobiota bacterium]
MRIFLAVLLSVTAASAAGSPEAARLAASAALAQTATPLTKAFKAQRMVQLRGQASLSGTGWIIGQHTSYVTVTLSGQLSASGDGGKVQTGNAAISQTVTLYLPPGQSAVYQTVSVRQNVALYCSGRPVGSTVVGGSFHVRGFRSGSYLRLSGSGPVSGSAFVNCGENPAQKR